MSVLGRIIGAVSASLSAHGVPEPGPGRFEQLLEDGERLFVLEAVYEGYLMHYGTPRAFRGMDEDLRLLAGDALYALGLSRLAEVGDLEAVAELSDLISLSAQAQAGCPPPDSDARRQVDRTPGRAQQSITPVKWPIPPPKTRTGSPATPPPAGPSAHSRGRPLPAGGS